MIAKVALTSTLVLLAGLSAVGDDNSSVAGETKMLMKLEPVLWKQVKIEDDFWKPRQDINRTVSIPHCFANPMFDDNLYKTIEAAAYSLAVCPDPALEQKMDETIAWIASTQDADGYRHTHFQNKEPEKKLKNLGDSHEFYTMGHLCEAAVAYYYATGKRSLLDVAVKFADFVDARYGDGPGKIFAYDGHPEVELALVRLWKATGEKRYLDLATFFINSRGSKFIAKVKNIPLDQYNGTYWQDDVPIREHTSINGHAVRAAYLFSGVTDVARESEDRGLLDMLDRVWSSASDRRMYITGGIGAKYVDEAFGADYELPNDSAYSESCAGIAMAMWSYRMCLLYGDARYADVMERVLYNIFPASVSLAGDTFFYINPLSDSGEKRRQSWFDCPCCPPNIARTMAGLGGYAYAVSDNALWVNLYIQGSATASISGKDVQIDVKTKYPWDGKVEISPKISAASAFGLHLRIPGWCPDASIKLNGKKLKNVEINHGYFVLDRTWEPGDQVSLDFPMPIQKIEANPLVKDDAGHIALTRGPIVYCLENCDQQAGLDQIAINLDSKLKAQWDGDLLNGVVSISGDGIAMEPSQDMSLYRNARSASKAHLVAVPYCTWANREAGAMEVWIPVGKP